MTAILTATCNVLHTLAALIFIGHYLLLSLLYLPVLVMETWDWQAAHKRLARYPGTAAPWMYGSILIFFLTGIVLMIVDSNYLGNWRLQQPVGGSDVGEAPRRCGNDRHRVLV